MSFNSFIYLYCLVLPLLCLQSEELANKQLALSSSHPPSSLLTTFEAEAKKAMEAWHVPGMAIAIVKDNKTLYAKGFGVTELGGKEKVTPHTLFEIGSLSKSFTSTLVALMVDEGKLDWEEEVIKHLPDFVLYDPWVTREFQIQDLLAQRSGLPPHAGDAQAYFGFTRQQMIDNLRHIKPASSFRSTFAYQNSFFLVAGNILENISGLSWEELIQQRLFTPLGMQDSNTSFEDYSNHKNAASLHKRVKGKTKKLPLSFPYRYVYTLFGPAGGINSTAFDMTNWLKLHLNHGVFNEAPLISKSNLSRTYRRYIYMGKFHEADNYYGLGWAIRDYSPYSIIWHDGGAAGVTNTLAFIPEEKLGIVILTNTSGTSLSHALAWQFFDLYYNKPQRNWSAELLEKHLLTEGEWKKRDKQTIEPTPALPLNQYTGTYFNSLYGKVEVNLTDKHLTLTIGPNRTQLSLEHWNRDTFTLAWPDLLEEESFFITFCSNADGNVEQLTIPLLENSLFTRL